MAEAVSPKAATKQAKKEAVNYLHCGYFFSLQYKSYIQRLIPMISMQPKTPSTPKDQSGESKTLFVGNLSFQVEQADVYVKVAFCYVIFILIIFLLDTFYCELGSLHVILTIEGTWVLLFL